MIILHLQWDWPLRQFQLKSVVAFRNANQPTFLMHPADFRVMHETAQKPTDSFLALSESSLAQLRIKVVLLSIEISG
jgi:hypothetical protein